MPSPFAVTTASNSVSLDVKRHGQAAFTVFNASGRPIRGRARLTPENPEAGGWLSLAGTAERDFPIAGTEQYTVHIAVPRNAPPGSYAFRLDMVGVENPDELFTQGPTVTFEVSGAVPKKAFPWWIVLAVIGGLLLCGVLAVGGYLIAKNWPSEEPTPLPTATATGEPTLTPVPSDTPTSTPTEEPTPTPFGGGTGRIVYVSSRDGNAEIYVMEENDSAPLRLTYDPEIDDWPGWSPDGQRIAFTRYSSGAPDVFVMNADGSSQTNLTNNTHWDSDPAWSPDGGQIAFSSNRGGDKLQIWVMAANGTNAVQLTNTPELNSSPAWSPDGSRIAFESYRDGQREIYVMNANGSAPTRLTYSGNNYGPDWSPDGQRIVFSSTDGIWAINIDGTLLTQLHSGTSYHPNWSPDGTQMLFESTSSGNFDIYVMNVDGTNVRQLTTNAALDAHSDWQPVP